VAFSWRASGAARLAGVLWLAVSVLVLGWVEAVRGVIGDVVAVDEFIVVLPWVLLVAGVWWNAHPMESLLREASLVRALDEGRPVYRPAGRLSAVWGHVRHQMMLPLAPLLMVGAWTESLARVAERAEEMLRAGRAQGWWGRALERVSDGPGSLETAAALASVAGVLGVLVLTPGVLRLVWDTAPLGPGELRTRLDGLLRAQRVRPASLRVWRTRGTLINGAVVGLVPPLRYIFLTDGLLDRLTPAQVEAVGAHEVGHIRRRHMVWLGTAILAAVLLSSVALGLVLAALGRSGASPVDVTAGLVCSLAAVVLTLGFVSRRFEWQADAFAAAHLSRAEGASVVTPGAVETMAGALRAVAESNGLPLRRFMWRHGSIAERIRRLESLVGLPVGALPVDRVARRVKRVSALALLAGVAPLVWEVLR
jgi:Zn-dependent protease with chaperone function